ncbi:MAG: aminomethyl-transferring glycine dehydrogenase [Planctomycetota bacterium]|jgi:glycine dehydrogenase|nr:aminomethyl-transferring glycine dehydrogenase [Planctomycetota bacterium]
MGTAPHDLRHPDQFVDRHVGPRRNELEQMAQAVGHTSLDALIDAAVPEQIRSVDPMRLPEPRGERDALRDLRTIAARNKVFRSYLGQGYHDCIVPPVIQRNVLENPGWYTQYTPYQAEISQGRMEGLLNFQTMIGDLCGLPIANASLLDEATAAAEAMAMANGHCGSDERNAIFVSNDCHPQTIAVIETRAQPLGIEVIVGDHKSFEPGPTVFAAVVQYPATDGALHDYDELAAAVHEAGAVVIAACDLLALCLFRPPGEWGADIAIGSAQRFGVPLGYGGPHAAFMACSDAFKRKIPGRIVGVSKDRLGQPALRLALQTREQHIRREKATSNICTAQALLANMAAMYAVYHGPEGLRAIAARIHCLACILSEGIRRIGYQVGPRRYFDTVRVDLVDRSAAEIIALAEQHEINLRLIDSQTIGISLDETTTTEQVELLWRVFNRDEASPFTAQDLAEPAGNGLSGPFARTSPYLAHPVFNRHRSETGMLRYLRSLEERDLSLCHGMIPLGSCTMKLNATAEMIPVTWPEFARLHPFAPSHQALGYRILFQQLEQWLAEITGFDAVSLQPNAGSQGEYAGLLAIRGYHRSRGQGHRDVCLIPTSAHGTNPASAVMAGMRVVAVRCNDRGDIDLADLEAKAEQHKDELAALMVTYPSTHGVFEEHIRQICDAIHVHGGQVYMDGANMNAQVGLCRPGELGADVCHLNLHKTFCIPHGGGGPGMGPICVSRHLAPFLPGHPLVDNGAPGQVGAISAAPWGSPSILVISWVYVAMMGNSGLTHATKAAICAANYLAKRLGEVFPVLYTGPGGLVAHECIVDLRPAKQSAGVSEVDVAKRLMDYGFHAPTMSWPVPGTMMIEPTESEPLEELDRFCDAMLAIAKEIDAIAAGEADPKDNLLVNAPHTAKEVVSDSWDHSYSREQAAFPSPSSRERKFWPPVARVDNAFGDRNLVCSCVGMEAFA